MVMPRTLLLLLAFALAERPAAWAGPPRAFAAQVPLRDLPVPEEEEPEAPPAADAEAPTPPAASGAAAEASSRGAETPAAAAPDPSAAPPTFRRGSGFNRLRGSFGLQVGQPFGLQAEVTLLDRNTFIGGVAWDFFYRSVTWSLDYRLTVYYAESVTYDARVGFFLGAGVRVGSFEPVRAYRRELPVTAGLRFPVGASLELRPLPIDVAVAISPLGFDVKELALVMPRWRPEAWIEIRARFPYTPF
ncbi:MAG: hypothetical protein HY904_21635 [Deltaproteobacteria bacterium]|nr:hypothetical protein [Deltaproteobacteria bacterium]